MPDSEITRFPHAVLEVKLLLEDDGKTPEWVEDLIGSGMLIEVHKFSKFIHGCAVLFRDDVRYAPFWVDDATLAASIVKSGAEELIDVPTPQLQKMLPHGGNSNVKANSRRQIAVSYQGSAGRFLLFTWNFHQICTYILT